MCYPNATKNDWGCIKSIHPCLSVSKLYLFYLYKVRCWYLECIFLGSSPFRWHQFWPSCDLEHVVHDDIAWAMMCHKQLFLAYFFHFLSHECIVLHSNLTQWVPRSESNCVLPLTSISKDTITKLPQKCVNFPHRKD